MPQIDFKPSQKQYQAYEYLTDQTTTELFFGGGIRSGKTRIAMYWVILMALKYPKTRYLVGRAELKVLKRTSLKTLLDIIDEWGLNGEIHHNKKDDILTFSNGSEVILQDLKLNPSDPDFNDLRGLELTGAVIDEANEISPKAYEVLITRLDYKLTEYNLIPKLLIVSNPCKNWLYDKFYKASLNNTLPPHRKVILATPEDNPYNQKAYIATLTPENLGESVYNQLVLGNWDYDDSDLALYDFNTLEAAYDRQPQVGFGQKYITCDPAGSGADSTVITLWNGWHCQQIIQLEDSDTTKTVQKIYQLMDAHGVHISNVVVDVVGIGAGIGDLLKGCKRFVANATPIGGEPYKSLKDQMYYRLAKQFKSGFISITPTDFNQQINQELEAHQMHNVDNDQKAQVTPKKIVKQMIGRSPDFADALSMRCIFDYVDIGKITILR